MIHESKYLLKSDNIDLSDLKDGKLFTLVLCNTLEGNIFVIIKVKWYVWTFLLL